MKTLGRLLLTILVVGFLVGLMLFAYLNTRERVTVNLIFWSLDRVPVTFIVLTSTLAGVLVTFFTSVAEDIRKAREIRRLQREVRQWQERAQEAAPPPGE